MSFFQYKAVTSDGKIVEGILEAADEQTASSRLQEQGQFPIQISANDQGGLLSSELKLPWQKRRVPQSDLLVFTQELSTLIQSGLPLDRSLRILSDLTENEYLGEIVKDLLRAIKGGKSLSEALGAYPQVFPKIYVNMVKAGEASGALDLILQRLIQYLEGSEELRNYFVSSLIYPVILTLVGAGSIILMVTFIIPKFAVIFENAGSPIPLPMQIMLTISGILTRFWWFFPLVGFGGWILFRRHLNSKEGRLSWDRRKLTLPLLGPVLRKAEVSRFSRTLGTLLNSAVPLLQSINIVRDIVGNQSIAVAIEPIKTGVKKGEGLAEPVREAGIFPPFALHLLKVGEETGRLDTMLLQIADTYDRELRTALKRLIALFEPAIILLMGLIIGTMVVSMLYSIFKINDVPL